MRGWMLAGIRRSPGPLIGTVVAAATAATLTVAALSIAVAHTTAPAGRLAGASVVVAGNTSLTVTTGGDATSVPLSAYRGVPASLASQLDQVPGVASAAGESGFPGGVVRPGDVDLIAVTAKPGISPDTLAGQIRAALHGGQGYTIATGAARGDLANLNVAAERANGKVLGVALIPPIVLISLFVLMATTALAVNLRRQRYTRLRMAGATRGQVRRAIMAELAVCGVTGGVLAFLPGLALGALGAHALAAHQMLPGRIDRVAQSLAAARRVRHRHGHRRAQRADRGAAGEPVLPRAGAAGNLRRTQVAAPGPAPARPRRGGRLGRPDGVHARQQEPGGPARTRASAAAGLHGGGGAARSGPCRVRGLAGQAQAAGGPSIRLALAAISAQPRRAASAVIPVALAVAMIGSVYFADASIAHATATQAGTTVTADHVLSGADLTDATLNRARALSGVRAAAGVTSVAVAVNDPDLEQDYGEAVAGGPLDQVLDLGVTAGHLTTLRPGQIAVSALEAGSGEMGVHVGSRVTVYLADGTPYRATVSAIYARSLATGDLLIPAAVATGHTGTVARFTQILASGGTAGALAGLGGVHVVSRDVANAQSKQATAQNSFANELILGIIATLAAVALLNTLVVTTVERRRVLRLLGRVGATRGQIAAVFGWQAVFVAVTGLIAGAAAGAVTLLAVTRAATGSWAPYIPPGSAAGLATAVVVATVGAVMIPFYAMARRDLSTR